jgi:osmoprotectant transport system substrate-binding protein
VRRLRLPAAIISVVALAVGLAVGLRAGSSSSSPVTSATTTQQAATGTQTVPPQPTQPTVTVVTTPTVPADELPGYGKPTVQLGDMNTPEQFIIGQLYQLALQQEGYTVSLTRNVGVAQVALAALRGGTLDLYPEYLDQWNAQVAGVHMRFHSLAASYGAGAAYAERHGIVLLPPTPFSDTAGVAVTSQYAASNHVTSIADLARGPGIIFAAPVVFATSPHGLPAVERAYRLHPGYVQVVYAVGSQYSWLGSGDAQAAYVTTTDPQLLGPEYKLLADPLNVFGYGDVVPVTTPRVLKLEGPAFAETIERIDAVLTTSAMRGLNWEVEVAGHNATQVASEFLQGQRITPPVLFAPVPTTTTNGSATATSTTETSTTATATSTTDTATTTTTTVTGTETSTTQTSDPAAG